MVDIILAVLYVLTLIAVCWFAVMPLQKINPNKIICNYKTLNDRVWERFARRGHKSDDPLVRALHTLDRNLLRRIMLCYTPSYIYTFVVCVILQGLFHFFERIIVTNGNTLTMKIYSYTVDWILGLVILFLMMIYVFQYKKITNLIGHVSSKRRNNYEIQ